MKGLKVARLALTIAVLASAAVPDAVGGQAPTRPGSQVPAPARPVLPWPAAERILVMPFDNPSGEGRLYWLREAAAVLLSEDLALSGAHAISRTERLRAFERLGVPPHASLSDATVIKLGELVGASTVVVGALGLDGEQIRVRAHTIKLDTGRIQTESSEQAPIQEFIRVFDRALVQLFPVLVRPLGHSEKDHAPLSAFENYIKGLIAETGPTQVKFLTAALTSHPGYDAARLALWQVHTAQNDHSKALTAVLEVPEKSSAWRRARFLAALSHMRLNQFDDAFALLTALEKGAGAAVSNNLGVVQLRRGAAAQGGSASFYFNRARESDPADPDYAFNLGYAYLMSKDLMAASYWLRETVRLSPTDGDAHYLLGLALAATGAAAEGNREKDLARRLSSTYADWDRRPAGDPVPRSLEREKDDIDPAPGARRAEFAFETTGQKDQQALVTFLLDAGRRLFKQENDREAAAALQRVTYLAPYQAEAHLLLGLIALRNGRLQEAIDSLKISLWSEESAAAHLGLAEAYLQAKELQPARTEVQRALALDPKSPEAKKLLERLGVSR